MGVTRSIRRSFPFFKKQLQVVLEDLETSKTLKEIATGISSFYRPEISNILEIDKKQTLKNLRGRPEVSNGAEIGRELLLKVSGQVICSHNQEKIPFEATVETKFKEFSEGAIFYTLLPSFPEGLEFSDLSSLIAADSVEVMKLEIGLDYFENREFPFLGMKLQELRERFYIVFTARPSGNGSTVEGAIENNNLQLSNGFSPILSEKIGFLARITGIPELAHKIND